MTEQPTSLSNDVPSKSELYNPILRAFRELGSATMPELVAQIIESMHLREDILDDLIPSDGTPTLQKRIGWARLELKHCGYVENVSRGVWTISESGQNIGEVDPTEVLRRSLDVQRTSGKPSREEPETDDDYADEGDDGDSVWRRHLRKILLEMDPTAFERLCGVILRAFGCTDVNVTRRSSDGGIDGTGTLLIQGMISFPIAFQSKKYQGSVGAPEVQQLRGSLSRPGERGLLITTGTFTPQARRVAQEGASVIDLIDGDALLDKLKERELGVKVEMVEQTTVETGWWESNYGVSLSDALDEDAE